MHDFDQMKEFGMLRLLKLISIMCVFIMTPTGPASARSPNFKTALAAHLDAVSSRNLDGLKSTLTHSEALDLYLPNGKMLSSKSEFIEFHQNWFRETGWTMHFEPVSSAVTRELAIATVRTRYEDTVDGKPYWSENWLTLVFKLEKGEWRLIHDQNTRIRSSADAV
jgi:ketosteroid isomerase-like protein